jgi:hypothetical protein
MSTDKFQPPEEELPAIADLLAINDITEETVLDAAERFKLRSPDRNLQLLMDAKEKTASDDLAVDEK